jgi:hypothetical protein
MKACGGGRAYTGSGRANGHGKVAPRGFHSWSPPVRASYPASHPRGRDVTGTTAARKSAGACPRRARRDIRRLRGRRNTRRRDGGSFAARRHRQREWSSRAPDPAPLPILSGGGAVLVVT